MATRIRKQWLDLTYSATGLTADDIKYSDTTTVKSVIDSLYSKIEYRTLTITKAGTGSGTITSDPSGINCGSTCSYQFTFGTNVTLTATPDSGSVFGGWSGDVTDSNSTIVVTMDSNRSVIAIFNIPYTLTVIKSGTGTGTVISSLSDINCGSECSYQFVHDTNVTLTATPDSGSVFSRWFGDVTCSCSTIIITMDSNKNVIAEFNALYTLTVTKSGTGTGTVISFPSGINCGTTCSYQFASGTSVILTATPDPSFAFDGWSGDVTDSNSTITVTMDSNKSVTATFNILYTLTVTQSGLGSGTGTVMSSPSGINCGVICSHQFSSGTNVTLTAIPDSGSAFDKWSGDATGTNSTVTITMNSDKKVTSVFNLLHTLTITKAGPGTGTVTSDPAGINCGTTCSYQFVEDTNVTLTATPDSSSIFSGWSGDVYESSSSSTITFTMYYDMNIIATFNIPHTLTVTKSGTGAGIVTSYPGGIDCGDTCSYQFASGSTVTLSATPNSSSVFDRWSGDNSGYDADIMITMDSDKSETAIFNILEAGYFAGGVDNSIIHNDINKLLFIDATISKIATTLSQYIKFQSTCNSSLAGYFAGGANGSYNQSFIDKLLFIDESRSTLATTLLQAISGQSACNSTLSGYFAGGVSSNYQNYIDKLLFIDDSRSTLTATLSQPINLQSACNSTLAGYFAGGIINGTLQSFIDKLLFSDDSRSTLDVTLSQSIYCQSACNSSIIGYFAGGNNSSGTQSFIDKLLFNKVLRYTLSEILSQTVEQQSACNSTLAGYFAGGYYYNGGYIYYNFVDKLLFNDETRSTLTATLTQGVAEQSACQSGGIV
jgi:hypothetical protein